MWAFTPLHITPHHLCISSTVEQLTFYGSYHNNKWNQLIHAYFVPTIFWTVAVWTAYTPNLAPSWHLADRFAWLPWHLNEYVWCST